MMTFTKCVDFPLLLLISLSSASFTTQESLNIAETENKLELDLLPESQEFRHSHDISSIPKFHMDFENKFTYFQELNHAFRKALDIQKFDVASKLLQQRADVNSKSNFGSTPLHIASFKNDALAVRFLLERNAE